MSKASEGKSEAHWWSDLVGRIQGYHPGVDKSFLSHLYHALEKISLPATHPPDKEGAVPLPVAGQDAPNSPVGPVRMPSGVHMPIHLPDVAAILVDLRLDTASVAAGLLLDGVNKRLITLGDVRRQFGEDVGFLLEGITKISLLSARANPHSKQTGESQAEEFRKMILAMAQDIRVILVRLAICLQQLRGMAAAQMAPPPRLVREILEIYSPIAHRLGIYWIKNELEDLAFQLSQPEVYASLCEQVALYRQGGADEVRKMVALLTRLLRKHNITGQVLGREKHMYSIYCKLQRKGVGLDALYDIVGYRIIVRKKADCYRALGMIHGEFRPIPGRLKDFIAMPKSNGYQSLHLVVLGPFGNRLEIQIRTEKMHQVAESGVAAHWSYKEGLHTKKHSGATGFEWLKRTLEL
ncbi:MAG: bifunctional (p)ppGpp synthetase/guanosine-3',5'-bis(diphosphate) 3'-pyrophosphohydrolase, partial [Magnetococcales bacterium]|nr:bifunctional (p)ppGpp synthetase/guanosine-3',5'-bis(diphosphate) 3'-pyrophosphohydrolase [Magnetococcales bacterium]